MTGRVGRALSVGTLFWLTATLVTAPTAMSDVGDSTRLLPATRLAPPPRSFSLVATGDVITESAVNSAAATLASGTGGRYDFAPLLAPIAPMIASANIAICHMEIPIGVPGERAGIYGSSLFDGT